MRWYRCRCFKTRWVLICGRLRCSLCWGNVSLSGYFVIGVAEIWPQEHTATNPSQAHPQMASYVGQSELLSLPPLAALACLNVMWPSKKVDVICRSQLRLCRCGPGSDRSLPHWPSLQLFLKWAPSLKMSGNVKVCGCMARAIRRTASKLARDTEKWRGRRKRQRWGGRALTADIHLTTYRAMVIITAGTISMITSWNMADFIGCTPITSCPLSAHNPTIMDKQGMDPWYLHIP